MFVELVFYCDILIFLNVWWLSLGTLGCVPESLYGDNNSITILLKIYQVLRSGIEF